MIDADPSTTGTRTCPLCDTPLDPQNPGHCSHCDWTVGYRRRQGAPLGSERDTAAVILSLIPGLGHLYKGHYLSGALFMAGGLVAFLAVGLIATFTMGLGVLLLPLYWVGVMLQVYWLEDRHSKRPSAQLRS